MHFNKYLVGGTITRVVTVLAVQPNLLTMFHTATTMA